MAKVHTLSSLPNFTLIRGLMIFYCVMSQISERCWLVKFCWKHFFLKNWKLYSCLYCLCGYAVVTKKFFSQNLLRNLNYHCIENNCPDDAKVKWEWYMYCFLVFFLDIWMWMMKWKWILKNTNKDVLPNPTQAIFRGSEPTRINFFSTEAIFAWPESTNPNF